MPRPAFPSEVESVVYGISFAGHDPVTALMCNTLLCLLPRRDQWQALVDDPSLAVNAVEETLRYESSQISWRRVTTKTPHSAMLMCLRERVDAQLCVSEPLAQPF